MFVPRSTFLATLIAPPLLLCFRSGAAAAAVPGSALTPEMEQGPFYIPDEHVRSDIAEGRPGVPLSLTLRVTDRRSGGPLVGAPVDIWQCDAMGVYSGYDAMQPPPGGGPPGAGGPPGGGPPGGGPPDGWPPGAGGPPPLAPSNHLRFLRGIQVTDADGVARFATIFPGFYEGRVNHVHIKVHAAAVAQPTGSDRVVHTGQLFFPERIAEAISQRAPYATHRIHRTTLAEDHVFNSEGGASSIARMTPTSHLAGAYEATLGLTIDTHAG